MDSNISNSNYLYGLSHRRSGRHVNYVTHLDSISCHQTPLYYISTQETCNFIESCRGCFEISENINYLHLLVCFLRASKNIEGILITTGFSIAFIIFYFSIIFVTTKFFLVPNAIAIFKRLAVPEYEYGMIVLAIMYSLPETMRNFVKCNSMHNQGSLLLSEYIGKLFGYYVCGYIGLSLYIRHAFGGIRHMQNAVVTIIGLFYVYLLLHACEISLHEDNSQAFDLKMHAWICLFIYFAFMAFTYLHARISKSSKTPIVKKRNDLSDISSDDQLDTRKSQNKLAKPWKLFVRIINPMLNLKKLPKFVTLACAGQYTVLAVLIPVVDAKRHMHGWCLPIICISIMFYPAIAFFFGIGPYEVIGLVILAIIMASLLLLLTHYKRVPVFHDAFALWGILVSVTVCSICNSELDTVVWQLASFLNDWSGDIIKLLFFSIGEHLMQSTLTATLIGIGYLDMAYGFVVGISIYTVYLPLPALTLQHCYKSEDLISISSNTETCYVFLIVVMLSSTLGLAITDFQLRPCHGFYFLIFFFMFTLFLFLSDEWVVHPYGSEHAVLVIDKHRLKNWA